MTQVDDVVDVKDVEILNETDSAILVRTEEGEEVWLPLSQVESIHRSTHKGGDWLVVKRWLAEKKGLA